jgi:hypothetical protein
MALRHRVLFPKCGKFVFQLNVQYSLRPNRNCSGLSEVPMLRPAFILSLMSSLLCAASAAPSLLEQAVENWLGERDHWAFTQRAVEYDDGKPRERLERYDPSRAGNGRWTLLAINGHVPTPDEHAAWAKKKFKKNPRRIDTPIGDFFDFEDAKIVARNGKLVNYEVPLRRDKNWLFQTDKVKVVVTVNSETRALEHLTATVREPVKVLLGLAKITAGKLDLSFLNFEDAAEPGPESAQPTGSARVSVSKFGERVEFTWSDFKRVSPAEGTPSASFRVLESVLPAR